MEHKDLEQNQRITLLALVIQSGLSLNQCLIQYAEKIKKA